MRRPVLCFGLVVLGLVGACKHDDGMPTGTATIHSGTPGGPRVTNLPPQTEPPAIGVRAELGDRLARAHCRHERSCALGDGETKLLREEACFADSRYALRASIDQWPCDPARARAGLEECLLAIRDADCSARTGEGAQIRACRASEICRRSNIAGQ
ncbi:MAG: hypothetical protein KIT84_26030 [Labilithrix sp.]|nr:hypothetical protein [Labilithrix sp.]MCW5814514.1 hypothetical protein [Labilithrix sp.]